MPLRKRKVDDTGNHFCDAYKLPNDYITTVSESFFIIEPGDDQAAADIVVKMAGDCIVKSQGRVFSRPQHSIVYTEGEKAVKNVILTMALDGLVIMTESKDGEHCHYSRSTTKFSGCIPRVLADYAIVDNGFVDRLWQNNLKYIAYIDGVYSFVDRRLLSLEEAKKAQIFFTRDTNRHRLNPAGMKQGQFCAVCILHNIHGELQCNTSMRLF